MCCVEIYGDRKRKSRKYALPPQCPQIPVRYVYLSSAHSNPLKTIRTIRNKRKTSTTRKKAKKKKKQEDDDKEEKGGLRNENPGHSAQPVLAFS